ncbi:hypothetical protein SO802_031921 [Lithocarpus litseifolius]|uniref:Uncharacterized protein n=1 Tax=Lithocarpus litseifolius TaxID=425828 RepID=A0AAW2BSF1_9ROSI
MLEWIRVRLITRLYTKRDRIEKYAGKLYPSIQDKLKKLKVESKQFSATPAGSFLYEVASQYERYVVDLVKKTCSCKGRGACTKYQIWICTLGCTPATIPAAYPDLPHEVCHSAFILTARKSSFIGRKSS